MRSNPFSGYSSKRLTYLEKDLQQNTTRLARGGNKLHSRHGRLARISYYHLSCIWTCQFIDYHVSVLGGITPATGEYIECTYRGASKRDTNNLCNSVEMRHLKPISFTSCWLPPACMSTVGMRLHIKVNRYDGTRTGGYMHTKRLLTTTAASTSVSENLRLGYCRCKRRHAERKSESALVKSHLKQHT